MVEKTSKHKGEGHRQRLRELLVGRTLRRALATLG